MAGEKSVPRTAVVGVIGPSYDDTALLVSRLTCARATPACNVLPPGCSWNPTPGLAAARLFFDGITRTLYIQLAREAFEGQHGGEGTEAFAGAWGECGPLYLAALHLFTSCHIIIWLAARPSVQVQLLHFFRSLQAAKRLISSGLQVTTAASGGQGDGNISQGNPGACTPNLLFAFQTPGNPVEQETLDVLRGQISGLLDRTSLWPTQEDKEPLFVLAEPFIACLLPSRDSHLATLEYAAFQPAPEEVAGEVAYRRLGKVVTQQLQRLHHAAAKQGGGGLPSLATWLAEAAALATDLQAADASCPLSPEDEEGEANALGGTSAAGERASGRDGHGQGLLLHSQGGAQTGERGEGPVRAGRAGLDGSVLKEVVQILRRSADPVSEFSRQTCHRAYAKARQVYLLGLPQVYGEARHALALKAAVKAFISAVQGPLAPTYQQRLKLACERTWREGRRQCTAYSLLGNPCTLPIHSLPESGESQEGTPALPHNSGHIFILADASGMSRQEVSDPFDLDAANGAAAWGWQRTTPGGIEVPMRALVLEAGPAKAKVHPVPPSSAKPRECGLSTLAMEDSAQQVPFNGRILVSHLELAEACSGDASLKADGFLASARQLSSLPLQVGRAADADEASHEANAVAPIAEGSLNDADFPALAAPTKAAATPASPREIIPLPNTTSDLKVLNWPKFGANVGTEASAPVRTAGEGAGQRGRGGKTGGKNTKASDLPKASSLLLGFEYETLDAQRFLLDPSLLAPSTIASRTLGGGNAKAAGSRTNKERRERVASAASLVSQDLPLFAQAPSTGAEVKEAREGTALVGQLRRIYIAAPALPVTFASCPRFRFQVGLQLVELAAETQIVLKPGMLTVLCLPFIYAVPTAFITTGQAAGVRAAKAAAPGASTSTAYVQAILVNAAAGGTLAKATAQENAVAAKDSSAQECLRVLGWPSTGRLGNGGALLAGTAVFPLEMV